MPAHVRPSAQLSADSQREQPVLRKVTSAACCECSSVLCGTWGDRWHVLCLLLHGERKLQGLLLAALHHLLPELPLVLDSLELRLNVLLGDLQQSQNAMICLLRNHIEDVPKALRAALAPSLVHAERHVLSALLPAQQFDIGLALIHSLSIIESRSREDPDNLSKLHHALGKRGGAMLEILKGLLIHLGIEDVVHGVHLRLPVLLVHVALLLQLPRCIAILLNIDLMRSALDCEAVGLFAQLENVALVFTKTALHAAHAEVQSA
mmetsp:Transcript_66997/g.146134  ORF Transcript_66997/g.146134 Transcript_66997/m.146134 type:complete len:264 (-) Transcript_66997:1272-2063(-)